MKEFIEKLIGKLEEYMDSHLIEHDSEECLHCTENEDDWCNCRNCFICVWDKAKAIVKELAEEYINTSTDTSSGWIPCSERLPQLYENTSDVVLVCGNNDYQHMAFWCSDGKWRYCQSGMIKEPMDWIEIVAWQPLPEPYKKGGEVNE